MNFSKNSFINIGNKKLLLSLLKSHFTSKLSIIKKEKHLLGVYIEEIFGGAVP